MLEVIDETVEGLHTGFLRHIMGKWVWRNSDRVCLTPTVDEVLVAEGVQLVTMCSGRRKCLVAL